MDELHRIQDERISAKRNPLEAPLNLFRVELHNHLDGALQHATIWELSKQKGIPLPGDGTLEDLTKACVVRNATNLIDFLKSFQYILPPVRDDIFAVERVALEFCEDEMRAGVAYVESRFCPHFLLRPETEKSTDANIRMAHLRDIVRAVLRGFRKAEEKAVEIDKNAYFKARVLISVIRGFPQMCQDAVQLAFEFKNQGVVGIDVAGCDSPHDDEAATFDPDIVAMYEKARKLGIRRTVHAGESGQADIVKKAVELLHAERIGHGYRVINDANILEECIQKSIHFECCPASSILTGSVKWENAINGGHPIIHFAEKGASFSLNSDDPTITATYVVDDAQLASYFGLSEHHIIEAAMNGARASFLPEREKQKLLDYLTKYFNKDV